MSSQNHSIQSYFPRQAKPIQSGSDGGAGGDNYPSPANEGVEDGNIQLLPCRTYAQTDIGGLQPGPGRVSVTGRIVNLWQTNSRGKLDAAAKGLWMVTLKDGTGALLVKLWYAKTAYKLRLGDLVRVWTPHMSLDDSHSPTKLFTPLVANIFPERDDQTRWHTQERDDGLTCKDPLTYRNGKPLAGLVTLKAFLDGGQDTTGTKILVCVKNIGGVKTFMTKKGVPTQRIDVSVFDDTAEVPLNLWNCVIPSASTWVPSETILLITNPLYKAGSRPSISIQKISYVDVNPIMTDATWLRDYAGRMNKQECVNPSFPAGGTVFDVETAETAIDSALWTLAEIDAFARRAPNEQLTGWLSLTLIEMNIYSLYQRKMLLCSDWLMLISCGFPIFANEISAKCAHCNKQISLRLNPKLVGLLIDETGGIAAGKLIWSDEAWSQFLGRTTEEILWLSREALAYLEHRCLFLRIAVLFGWDAKIGRLCVLKVKVV